MHSKSLTIAATSMFGVFGLYMATAQKREADTTNEVKVVNALQEADLKVPKSAKKSKKKLLVFSVTNGYRHKSIDLGKQTLELMSETTNAFDVVISNDLENFEKGKIETFDAICFLNTTQNVFAPHKKQLKKMSDDQKKEHHKLELARKENLMNFIEEGNGFVGIHAATDTFYEWPEYGEMLGGYFDGHPWGSRSEVSLIADEATKNHALMEGVIPKSGELRFKEEIYQFKDPYDSKKLTMLLRLDVENSDKVKKMKRKDNDYGVGWVKDHKEGRVFYSALGHNDHIYYNKHVLRHFYSGIMYALGVEE